MSGSHAISSHGRYYRNESQTLKVPFASRKLSDEKVHRASRSSERLILDCKSKCSAPFISHGTRNGNRQRRSRLSASSDVAAPDKDAPESDKDTDLEQAVGILKQAVKGKTVPKPLVTAAMIKLGKLKLNDDTYAETIGRGKDGIFWQLVFVANAKETAKASKGEKATGTYVPINVAQLWKRDGGVFENGVFLGPIGAFVAAGWYEYSKNAAKKLPFDYNKIKIRLGPKWLSFDIKIDHKGKPGPFFLLHYADDDIVVAKGRGGGTALWSRASLTWEMKNIR